MGGFTLTHNMTEMTADLETQRAARHGAYALVGLPETAPACPFCGLTPHVKMCGSQRAAMAQTYTTSYDPIRSYVGLYRDGCELSEQETAAELNRLRTTIEERARMDAEDMQRCQAYAAGLRAEIDQARAHVGVLVKWAGAPQYAINKDERAAIVNAQAWLKKDTE